MIQVFGVRPQQLRPPCRLAVAVLMVAGLMTAGGARGEGRAVGPWQVAEGVYRSTSPTRALYYLTDQPYVVRLTLVPQAP